MIRVYLLIGAVLTGAGGFWYVSHLKGQVAALTDALTIQRVALRSCEAQRSNLREDKESDDEIDRLDVDDLRRRASEFLQP